MSEGSLEIGALLVATAKRIEDYGVFFDHDGSTILVLITEMAEGVVSHPSDLVSIGEELQLKLLKYNVDKNEYSATMRI